MGAKLYGYFMVPFCWLQQFVSVSSSSKRGIPAFLILSLKMINPEYEMTCEEHHGGGTAAAGMTKPGESRGAVIWSMVPKAIEKVPGRL
jgi:hypothetical protein